VVVLVVGLLPAAAPPAGLTTEQQVRLKEAARLGAEASKLLQAGQLAQAEAAWRQKLALERAVHGTDHEVVAGSLEQLATLQASREAFPQARQTREQVLGIRTRLYGAGDWRVTDARLAVQDVDLRARLSPEQRQQLNRATALNGQVVRLWQQGRPERAIPLAEESLAIRRRLLGEKHRHHAQSLSNLGAQYEVLGQLREAQRCYLQARNIWKEVVGENHPAYATNLTNLASVHQKMGEYRKALPLFERGRDITRATLGEYHPDYVNSLLHLASVYQEMGEYRKAVPLVERARDISRAALGENHLDYASSLIQLASAYREMGEYRKALPLLERALEIRRAALGEDHPAYANSLDNLAALYMAAGEYRKALPLLERARDIRRAARGENHPDYANSLNNLARVHQQMGEYRKALPLLERARDITRAALGENHPHYATSLNNLALLYNALGEYSKALPLWERVRDIRRARGEDHPAYATSLNNLASVYLYQGEYGKALPLLERALEIRRAALGENHPDYAQSLSNLASLHLLQGEYGKALPLLERVRDIRRAALGEDHPEYASSLNRLALLHLNQGEYGKALPLLERVRDIRRAALGEKHPRYADCLHSLGVLARARDESKEAERLLSRALTLDRDHLDDTFRILNDRQRLDKLSQHRIWLFDYLSVTAGSDIWSARAYAQVLATKGALASRQAEEFLARDQPRLRPLFDELRQARAGLARLQSQVPATTEQQKDWLERFREQERRKERAEADLARQSDTFRRFLGLRQAGAAEVCAALPADTVLIDFVFYRHATLRARPEGRNHWVGESRMLAFVLARGREVVCLPLGKADDIRQLVQDWREAVRTGKDPNPAGEELVRRVWAPLRKHLGKAQVVLVAPDGPLASLPFAALPGSRKGSWLLEEVAIGYLSSGRQLLELEADRDRPASSGLLALGGLDYGEVDPAGTTGLRLGVRRQAWGELPGTRREAEQIAAAFRAAFPDERPPELLRGRDGDAGRLQRELGTEAKQRWRWLHLATHAFFDPPASVPRPRVEGAFSFAQEHEQLTVGRMPLLCSGLVLSGANADPERGGLTALEVSGLNLRGCELAVLSACDTGRGAVALGEGVLGLQWGFQAAGARTVLSSQWSVSDAATSVLMEEFYAHLWGKKAMSKLEALRQAQLTVLRQPERVVRRARELRAELAKRGVSEEELAKRGIGRESVERPALPRDAKGPLSPPGWWAAFVLSGDWR
jgi:CHAT domain-containing protein/tetratricopeptide (TPR) repeat protein